MQSEPWVNDDGEGFGRDTPSPFAGLAPGDRRVGDRAGRGGGLESAAAIDHGGLSIGCPSGRRPIDLVHLSAQTCGDTLLEREVLTLLKAQLEGAPARLDAADGETRRVLAHALKGAALNMGAFPLARAASALEETPDDAKRLVDLLAIIGLTGAMVDRLIA